MERPDDYELISSDPLGFFSRNSQHIIIDEAQQYPQLFAVLRSIIDNVRQTVGRFLLTGSSSPDIVKGLSESLAGRIATVELSPFIIEEIIRGLSCTMETNLDFSFYRTRDKAEIDLIIEGNFGVIPIEIKLGSITSQLKLNSLKNFIADMQCNFGILINNAQRIERISAKIIQIPARYF